MTERLTCRHTPTNVIWPDGVDLSDLRCNICRTPSPYPWAAPELKAPAAIGTPDEMDRLEAKVRELLARIDKLEGELADAERARDSHFESWKFSMSRAAQKGQEARWAMADLGKALGLLRTIVNQFDLDTHLDDFIEQARAFLARTVVEATP